MDVPLTSGRLASPETMDDDDDDDEVENILFCDLEAYLLRRKATEALRVSNDDATASMELDSEAATEDDVRPHPRLTSRKQKPVPQRRINSSVWCVCFSLLLFACDVGRVLVLF